MGLVHPEIKPMRKEAHPRLEAYYNCETNILHVGYREGGSDEELIEAMLNHELMHWILDGFIGCKASIKLDNLFHGLNPSTIEFHNNGER